MVFVVIIQHDTKPSDPNISELIAEFGDYKVKIWESHGDTMYQCYYKILKYYKHHQQPLLIIKDNSIVHYPVNYLTKIIDLNADLYALSSYHIPCHKIIYTDCISSYVKAYECPVAVTCLQALMLSSRAQIVLYKAIKNNNNNYSLEFLIASCQFRSIVFYPNLISMDPLLATNIKDYENLNYALIQHHHREDLPTQIAWIVLLIILIVFLIFLVPYFKHYRYDAGLL